jgi:hypothetical protein
MIAASRRGDAMKLRIAMWAGVGALVVVLWNLYLPAISSTIGWALVCLTCPIALAHQYALSFYFVFLMNAATYALVGIVVETMRRQYKQTKPA